MAEFEGWLPMGKQLSLDGEPSVSYRNHNPGNLRSSIFQIGVRDGFAVFFNDQTGMFAMQHDIINKALGKNNLGLNGNSTISDLIRVWTADNEEIEKKYIDYVCLKTGLTPETKLEKLIK